MRQNCTNQYAIEATAAARLKSWIKLQNENEQNNRQKSEKRKQ